MNTQQAAPTKAAREVGSLPDERKNRAGGSAAAGGFDFQAEAFALVAAKLLAGESLNWVDADGARIPEAVVVETGTGGDDIKILLSGGAVIELQSKRGIDRGSDLWKALAALARAVERDAKVYGVDPSPQSWTR